jgi:glutamate synthase domain-containing protein 3
MQVMAAQLGGDVESAIIREFGYAEIKTIKKNNSLLRDILDRIDAEDCANKVLVDWDYFLPRFVRVVPNDYNRVLQAQRKMRETGLTPEEAEMAAFELNVADVARVGGK